VRVLKRFPRFVVLCLLLPLHLVATLLTGAYIAVISPGRRNAQLETRWALAQRLGTNRGEVLRRTMAGGFNTAQLDFVTVRPGDVETVARQIADGLVAEGYTKHAKHERFPDERWTVFVPPPGLGLPQVSFAIAAPGGLVDGTDIPVAEGHSGVRFII
jgi:hypothetical protein